MTESELDHILTFRWPELLRRVMATEADDWVRGFVRSIARHGKRPGWKPSPKQAAIMRRLLNEFLAPPEPELELIER